MKTTAHIIFTVILVWFIAAHIVFALRHSWMTDTERLYYTRSAMMFKQVSIHEARP